MARLTDIDALLEKVTKLVANGGNTAETVGKIIIAITDAPIADAVEVVHGRWMPGYPISCSVCGGAAATDYEDANRYEAWITRYCPNCGAKMDLEVDNETTD